MTSQEVWSFWYMEQIEDKALAREMNAERVASMTLRLLEGQVSELGDMFLIVSEEPAFQNATHKERILEAERRLQKEKQD